MIDREDVFRRFDEIGGWTYATSDLVACRELAKRILDAGRRNELITYSDLVSGVPFNLPNVNGGKPYVIDTSDWQCLDRDIIGDFLDYISVTSYRAADFMASVLVIEKESQMPSDPFFKWMQELNVIPNRSERVVEKFWVEQVAKAIDWYKANPDGFEIG